MITIYIERNKEGHIVAFAADGHSGYAELGSDIVCAGVSTLLQTALLGLTEYLALRVSYKVSPGKMSVALLDQDTNGQTDAVLESMMLGLRQIAKTYDKYVCIKEHRR